MKHHLVVKLRRAISEPPRIPDWVTFITDKSAEITTAEPGLDAVLHGANRAFWVTHEYAPARENWAPLELEHGLDRSYRLVMQGEATRFPGDLMTRLSALPSVETARQLEIGGAPIPDRETIAAPQSRDSGRRAAIGLDFAHALSRGRPDIRIAVLDTGVNLDHPELRGKIVGKVDFVDLEGLEIGRASCRERV